MAQCEGENNLKQVKKILCVGLCNIDIIQVCETYPVEDSDQRCQSSRWQRGGNASNNCTVLSLLGADCELLASFSDSKMFHFALDDMRERKIAFDHCVYHRDVQVPLSTVWLSLATGTRTIVHSNPDLPELTLEDFRKLNLNDYAWIHFEGRRNTPAIVQMIRSIVEWNNRSETHKVKISVELEKPRHSNLDLLVDGVDVVFVGKDFARFLGNGSARETISALKQSHLHGHRSPIIICPWGSSDTVAIDEQDRWFVQPTFPPPVIRDSLGAGDTFVAACIFKFLEKESLPIVLEFASRLAGQKLAHFGFDGIKRH